MTPLYLFINTINHNRPLFAAFDGDGHIMCSHQFINRQEDLVEGLSDFLKKIRIAEIKAILVVSGPGSFSASRAGIVLANSFNFVSKTSVLSIKDTGDSTEELIKNNLNKLKRGKKIAEGEVYYQREPNITRPLVK